MSRYIDADKLKKSLSIPSASIIEIGNSIMAQIDDIPTADVVEVIRCKDCKYGEVDDADFPNQYLCHHHGSAWNEGNHYCSYAERADA